MTTTFSPDPASGDAAMPRRHRVRSGLAAMALAVAGVVAMAPAAGAQTVSSTGAPGAEYVGPMAAGGSTSVFSTTGALSLGTTVYRSPATTGAQRVTIETRFWQYTPPATPWSSGSWSIAPGGDIVSSGGWSYRAGDYWSVVPAVVVYAGTYRYSADVIVRWFDSAGRQLGSRIAAMKSTSDYVCANAACFITTVPNYGFAVYLT